MDRANDCQVVVHCFFFEHLHNSKGGGTVEARCWLVTQKQVGIGDELVADTGSLPFSSGDSLHQYSTDMSVCTVFEAQP